MPPPEHPEHHYVFDPRRFVSTAGTVLVWLGDDNNLGEEYARHAVEQYDIAADDGRWMRRLALARLTLGQMLARRGEASEAAHQGRLSLDSWQAVHSDLIYYEDLDRDLQAHYPGSTEASEFHEQLVETLREIDAKAPPGDDQA